jgi:predicted nucleic acid-binding protein
MIPYADTNFFTNRFMDLVHRSAAESLLLTIRKNGAPPLPATWLVRMELTNALQRLIFESRQGTQQFRATPEAVMIAETEFFREIETGEFVTERPLDLADLESTFDLLAHRHTPKHGFRTYDILHVASAILLGCDTFWSFDIKARKLAKLEGLRTN